jgi:hypothetical protein
VTFNISRREDVDAVIGIVRKKLDDLRKKTGK